MSFFNIKKSIESNEIFNNCSCRKKKCIESSKIVWDNSYGDNIHIRIDGCIFKEGSEIKRCDCLIIFNYNKNNKVYSFFIEAKETYGYHIKDIVKKLESGIKNILETNNIIKENSIIVPVLYSKTHISNAKRVFHLFPVKINDENINISYLNYGIDIINAIKE